MLFSLFPLFSLFQNDETPDLGDLMFSLAYLPSAERLTVVILKARSLRAIKLMEGDKRTSGKAAIASQCKSNDKLIAALLFILRLLLFEEMAKLSRFV